MLKKFKSFSYMQKSFFILGITGIICFLFYTYLAGANGQLDEVPYWDVARNDLLGAFICLNAFWYSRISSLLKELKDK